MTLAWAVVSDNNRLLHSQAHYNALELTQRPLEIMIENENPASVMVQCESNPEADAYFK